MRLKFTLVCLSIALLPGCGSSPPPRSSASPSAGNAVDACSVLPKTAVDASFAEVFAQDHGSPPTATHCYSHGQVTEIVVDLETSGAAVAMRVYRDVHVSEVPLSGLGDEAYFEAAAADIEVRQGDRWFEIALEKHKTLTPEELQAKLTELAAAVLKMI